VLRNAGVAIGHSLLGWTSLQQGLAKLDVDAARIAEDLDQNWEVLAEAIQTVMRRYGVPNPYEQLKALTRGKTGIGQEDLRRFVGGLALPPEAKAALVALSPDRYIGLAEKLARRV
jgi:adenylosuccinate lyase